MEGNRWQPLVKAVNNHNIDEVKNIFDGHKVTEKEFINQKSGNTAIHLASQTGAVDILRFLVENCISSKEDLEVVNYDGRTSLHEAVTSNQEEAVKYLLEEGANVNALKRGSWTPLMLACTMETEESARIARELVNYGADLRVQNKEGWTSVHLTVRTGGPYMEEILRFLVEGDRDALLIKLSNGRTVMHTAAGHCNEYAMQYLTEKDPRCVSFLSARDASGTTPFLDAADSALPNCVKILKLILRHYNALPDRDFKQFTALHCAARSDNVSAIQYLVKDLGMDVDVTTPGGITPLHLAVRAGKAHAARLLLALAADPYRLDDHNRSAIDYNIGNLLPKTQQYLQNS